MKLVNSLSQKAIAVRDKALQRAKEMKDLDNSPLDHNRTRGQVEVYQAPVTSGEDGFVRTGHARFDRNGSPVDMNISDFKPGKYGEQANEVVLQKTFAKQINVEESTFENYGQASEHKNATFLQGSGEIVAYSETSQLLSHNSLTHQADKGLRSRSVQDCCMRYVVCFLLVVACSWSVQAGTVEGTVSVKVRKKVKRKGKGAGTSRYKTKGKTRRTKGVSETQNVVVSLPTIKATAKAKGKASVKQLNKAFVPYVTAVQQGSTISFPNGDKIYHSVYSESTPQKFHLPEYPKGESRDVKFTKAGHVELYCSIHSHMSAHILVLPNNFFTRPTKKGSFSLKNVPAGKHKIKAWHPKLGEVTKMVTVPKDGVVKVNFALK